MNYINQNELNHRKYKQNEDLFNDLQNIKLFRNKLKN